MSSSQPAPLDVYGKTDQLESATLDAIVTRLEARGQNTHFLQMMNQYLDAMQVDQAQSVLDLGCGTGVAARAIAKRPGFSGKVTGIDLSDHLIAAASRFASQEGVTDRVAFLVGDTRSLKLQDDSFDALVAHTLISHVDDYEQAINEMVRVVKPSGLIAIFDGDYASVTFGHPDPDEGKRIDELIIQGIITQPRVMRQMPRLLKDAGLDLVDSFANVICDVGKADFWASAIESFRNLLPTAGVMSKEEAMAWADARMQDSAEGMFFGSSNYLTYIARIPD